MNKLFIEQLADLAYRCPDEGGSKGMLKEIVALAKKVEGMGFDEVERVIEKEVEVLIGWVEEAPTEDTLSLVQNLYIASAILYVLIPRSSRIEILEMFLAVSDMYPEKIMDTELYNKEYSFGVPLLPAFGDGRC